MHQCEVKSLSKDGTYLKIDSKIVALIQGQHLIEDYQYILTKYILYICHVFPCRWITNHFQSQSPCLQVLIKQNFESYCPILWMGMAKLLIYLLGWLAHLVCLSACNTRVIIDASSSPLVSLMPNSCNKT